MPNETREMITALMQEFRRHFGALVNVDGIEKPRTLRSLSNAQLRKVAALWYRPEQIHKLADQLLGLAEASHRILQERTFEAQRNLDRTFWAPVKRYNEQLIASGVERPDRIQRMAVFKTALEVEPKSI